MLRCMASLGHLQPLYKLPALVRDSSSLGCSLLYPLHDVGFFAGNRDAVGAAPADGVFHDAGFRECPKAAFKECLLPCPLEFRSKRYCSPCIETNNASMTIRRHSECMRTTGGALKGIPLPHQDR